MDWGLLINLILTILIEGLVAFIYGVKNKIDQLEIILINCITNISLTLIIRVLTPLVSNSIINLIIIGLEILIFIIEGILFNKLLETKKNKWILSLLVNLSSFVIGLIIMFII